MRKVEVTVHIQTSPEEVIRAFTDQAMLSGWWQVQRSLIEPKRGGVYTLAWNITQTGFGYVSSGVVTAYHANRELIIGDLVYLNPERPILGPMSLTVRARRKDDLTEVYICQDGYRSGKDWDWYYEAVKYAWPVVLQNLKVYLEDR